MNATCTGDDELRAAVAVVHDIAFATRHHDEHTILNAHKILARHRHEHAGALDDALDAYLDEATWHHGPLVLRAAVSHLAHQLGIPDPAIAHIAEQGTLF